MKVYVMDLPLMKPVWLMLIRFGISFCRLVVRIFEMILRVQFCKQIGLNVSTSTAACFFGIRTMYDLFSLSRSAYPQKKASNRRMISPFTDGHAALKKAGPKPSGPDALSMFMDSKAFRVSTSEKVAEIAELGETCPT